MKSRNSKTNSIRAALVAAVCAAAGGLCPILASAQTSVPSYASGEERIHGRIASFDGKYNLQIRDDRGFVDNVNLHSGTIINPTGLRLATGQSITVLGHNAGKTFDANEIDTAYTEYGPRYGYRYGYGYAPYAYRAYPEFGVGFRDRGFGFRGWF